MCLFVFCNNFLKKLHYRRPGMVLECFFTLFLKKTAHLQPTVDPVCAKAMFSNATLTHEIEEKIAHHKWAISVKSELRHRALQEKEGQEETELTDYLFLIYRLLKGTTQKERGPKPNA